jgi:hypothetical protein
MRLTYLIAERGNPNGEKAERCPFPPCVDSMRRGGSSGADGPFRGFAWRVPGPRRMRIGALNTCAPQKFRPTAGRPSCNEDRSRTRLTCSGTLVRSVYKNQPIWRVQTLHSILDCELSAPAQNTTLMTTFALLAGCCWRRSGCTERSRTPSRNAPTRSGYVWR